MGGWQDTGISQKPLRRRAKKRGAFPTGLWGVAGFWIPLIFVPRLTTLEAYLFSFSHTHVSQR